METWIPDKIRISATRRVIDSCKTRIEATICGFDWEGFGPNKETDFSNTAKIGSKPVKMRKQKQKNTHFNL
jgi:hypothetical protein